MTHAEGLDDGPDYTPDGAFIWFNSMRSGNMKLWRMRADGSEQTQFTFNEDTRDWFPTPRRTANGSRSFLSEPMWRQATIRPANMSR